LDEIEKGNQSILDLLLQALDEGYITDGMGEKVQLTNNIIIATSNAGALEIKEGVQSGTPYESLKGQVMENLQQKGIFKPEFLNRFDGLILFRPLELSEILEVAMLMFVEIQKEYASKGYKIELEAGLLESLAQKGYHPEMGARPMRRVFQDVLETYLADEILKGNVKKGEDFIVDKSHLEMPI
jgi:ATP-dependent Clp protease ATP-binding subunit ClpA